MYLWHKHAQQFDQKKKKKEPPASEFVLEDIYKWKDQAKNMVWLNLVSTVVEEKKTFLLKCLFPHSLFLGLFSWIWKPRGTIHWHWDRLSQPSATTNNKKWIILQTEPFTLPLIHSFISHCPRLSDCHSLIERRASFPRSLCEEVIILR